MSKKISDLVGEEIREHKKAIKDEECKGHWIRSVWTGVAVFVPKAYVSMPSCPICHGKLPGCLDWTIRHGVAMCRCTAQFICLHRDDKGKLLEKPPECIVPEELIPKYREAWNNRESMENYIEKIQVINDEWDTKYPEHIKDTAYPHLHRRK